MTRLTCKSAYRNEWCDARTVGGKEGTQDVEHQYLGPCRAWYLPQNLSGCTPCSLLIKSQSCYVTHRSSAVEKMSKRPSSPSMAGTLTKRAKTEASANSGQMVISTSGNTREQALIRTVKRTSGLEAPIVALTGAHGVSTCIDPFLDWC